MEAARGVYEAEREELQRSQRVQKQLTEVLSTLRKRGEELAVENARMLAEARDASFYELQEEFQTNREECEAAEREHLEVEQETAELRRQATEHEALAQERREASAAAEVHIEALEQERLAADAAREEASNRARSMVSADILQRVTEESEQLKERLADQEAEACRLRQALMDSWASRADPDATPQPGASLEDLDGMEEQLQWLNRMQQESSAEVQRMQFLERQEATLQARLREVSEEKAQLQSARVDLGNVGGTLREAIASQSDRWVHTVDDLEQKRRTTDQDRHKLLSECADLQARLETIKPELENIVALETEHTRCKREHGRLVDGSLRLREVNSGLTVLLLGGDAPPTSTGDFDGAGLAEALTRVLQLQKRLNERTEAQEMEKQKLVDRIRELERQTQTLPDDVPSRPAFAPSSRGGRSAAQESTATPASAALKSATSALKGGFGKLRGVAGGVL